MIVAKRQQLKPTAKVAFAGGSGETSHALRCQVLINDQSICYNSFSM